MNECNHPAGTNNTGSIARAQSDGRVIIVTELLADATNHPHTANQGHGKP